MTDEHAVTTGTMFIILLIIVGMAFYGSILVDEPTVDRTLSLNQSESEEITVYNDLNATLTMVDQGNDNVTVELKDTSTDETATNTFDVGTAVDFQLEGSTISVNATSINDPSTAMMEYTYPPTYGWPEPLKTVADNIGFVVMGFVLFILVVGLILA